MKKKALSLILSAAMALSLTIVPVSAVSVSNFSDVSSDSWYYDSVSYVAEKDYMNGTSATTFEPNGNMTRAMFATVISRVAGAEVDNSAVSEFTDVESGKWYTGAIEWGVENDLLNGYGNGLFGTNNSITRQDICTLTQRFLNWYCEQNNCTLAVDPKVESFTDAASIADYAKEAVEFCRDAGLLTGYEDGSFRPLGTATRAEIAAVIERIEMAIESAEPAGPVVSYTDEDGNKATLAIKAGDVITVDPNGGSVTYDNTTHRDEFTITATEDGITLPNATRSGYHFDGWKVEKDANGAYIFTAQWTRTSSGGGGGNNPGTNPGDQNETADYSVSVSISEADKPNISFKLNAIDMEGNTTADKTKYHVVFNSEGDVIGGEDISLISIAKDLCDEENINPILDELKDTTYEVDGITRTLIDEAGVIHEIVVYQARMSNVISELTTANGDRVIDIIADQAGVDSNDVTEVLTILDTGGVPSEEEMGIVQALYNELDTQIENGNIAEYVQNNVDQDLLDKLGLPDSQAIDNLAIEYRNKLGNLLNPSNEEGTAEVNEATGRTTGTPVSDTSTAGGILVTVNPVEWIIDQFDEEAGDDYSGIWNRIQNALGEEYSDEFATLKKNKDVIDALISEVEPENFFNGPNADKLYSLKDAAGYQNTFRAIIDAADTVRQNIVVGKDAGHVADILEKLRDSDSLSEYDFIGDLLPSGRINFIAELLVKEDPKLTDITTENYNKSITIALNSSNTEREADININLNTALDKLLKKMGIDVSDESVASLKNALVDKLQGTYTVSVDVTRNECKH